MFAGLLEQAMMAPAFGYASMTVLADPWNGVWLPCETASVASRSECSVLSSLMATSPWDTWGQRGPALQRHAQKMPLRVWGRGRSRKVRKKWTISYIYIPVSTNRVEKKVFSRKGIFSHQIQQKTSSGGNCISAPSSAIWLDGDSYLVRLMEAFGFLGLGHVLECETLLNSKWVQLLHRFFKWHPCPQSMMWRLGAGHGREASFNFSTEARDPYNHICFLEALFWNMAMPIQPHNIMTFKSQMTPANLGPLMHTCSFLQVFSGQSMRGLWGHVAAKSGWSWLNTFLKPVGGIVELSVSYLLAFGSKLGDFPWV